MLTFSAITGLFLMFASLGEWSLPAARGQVDPGQKKTESGPDEAATDYIKRVREALYAHESIQANVEQTVTIGVQKFRVTGQYLSSGQKLRLQYNIEPDQGVSGSLLEVCDGKELWSLIKVGDGKPRVTHRDIQQIKAAAGNSRNVPDVILTAELGLGGLTALIASLERTMIFDAMKEASADDGGRTIIQGRWKPEIVARWPRSKDDLLPDYIPDMVRLWIDPQTQFPVRIVYIKRVMEKDKKVNRPMVNLTFKNILFNAPVSDQEFTFVTPEGAVPEDTTRLFLDRMKKRAEEANAAKPQPEAALPAGQ